MPIEAVTEAGMLSLPWESNQEQAYLRSNGRTVLFNTLGWRTQDVLSGTSFRLVCTFAFESDYYSGRDRAGMEKEKKEEGQRQSRAYGEPPMNPICRDWVSGFPLAKAGTWKRLFRRWYPNTQTVEALFGADTDRERAEDGRRDDGGLNKGLLKFRHAIVHTMPNDRTGRYTITPRKPAQGVAAGPIDYEVVGPRARCTLVIDYLPADCDADDARNNCVDLLQAAVEAKAGAIGAKTAGGCFGKIRLREATVIAGTGLAIRRSDFAGIDLVGVKLAISPENH